MPQAALTRETWKRLSPDERRAQLIAVAEELFQSRPYEDISIVDVARAAGITHGLIYHYFPSKEALFTASFEARAKELLERCSADLSLPLPEQAERGVRGYLDYVEAHRVSYINLFRGVLVSHREFVRICEDTRRAIVERFITALGLQHLSLRATRLSLRGYLGYVEAAVLEWLERRTVPRESLERMIFAVIGAALRAGLDEDAKELGEFPIDRIFEAYDRHFHASA